MLFVQLIVQLIDFFASFFKGATPTGRKTVEPAAAAMGFIEDRFQQAGALQAMQQRVEGAGADAVAVVREFFHHRQAKDGFLRGMEQHMDANKAEKEFPSVILHSIHYTAR